MLKMPLQPQPNGRAFYIDGGSGGTFDQALPPPSSPPNDHKETVIRIFLSAAYRGDTAPATAFTGGAKAP
jgi:hypothetical protein